jgi:hypothetical protein
MKQENNSPTDVYKAFIIAWRNGDVEAIKDTLAKSTLDIVESISANQEKSFYGALNSVRQFFVQDPSERLPHIRKEKVGGNTACIEAEDIASGEFNGFVFIRENNAWKLALEREVIAVTMVETSIFECLVSCGQTIIKIILGKIKTK